MSTTYYIETQNRKHQWEILPDQFVMGLGIPVELHPLMHMGYGSLPYSFCERGYPKGNVSDQLRILFDAAERVPKTANWLTRADLIKKTAELLIIPDKDALKFRQRLIKFINELPDHTGDPKHQRIVYWMS